VRCVDGAARTGVAASLLEGIDRFRATILFTSPTAYRAMLSHLGARISAACARACRRERRCGGHVLAWEARTGFG
jgi:acyl-coenzyme A synthetase/AMP-(fatty) acid ligase